MIKEHNAPRNFFGGYFHQDWDLDGTTWQEVLHKYFELYPEASELQTVADGLRQLLRMFPNDADVFRGRRPYRLLLFPWSSLGAKGAGRRYS